MQKRKTLPLLAHWCKTLIAFFKPYAALEPAYLYFNVAFELSELARANLYLQKACRHPTRREPDLSTPCDDEAAGIDFVASVNSEALFMANFSGTVLIVLLAAWSDKAGRRRRRKLCLLVPMAIKTLQLVSMCFQSLFWDWSVWFAVLTEGSFTASLTMRVASNIYICSVSTNAERIFRMTLLNVLLSFCTIVASGSSGYLLRYLGFFYTYALCAALALLSVIHVALFLKNPPKKCDAKEEEEEEATGDGFVKSCLDFVDIRSVLNAFKLFFGKRRGKERTVVWMISLISVLAWSSIGGEQSVLYLYLRYKFGWNEEEYGLYYQYKLIGYSVGSLICLGMSKYLKMSDYALGTFAAFWSIFAAAGYIFATENWHIYLLPLLDIFRNFSVNVGDSLQSKFFENDEFGRMFCVHEALNAFIALTFPAYNELFQNTMNFAPSAVFVLSSTINTCIYVLYGICFMLMKNVSEKS